MKRNVYSRSTALFVAFTLFAASARTSAQDTVTISAAEFQRMVYSAHLLTYLAEKPELDASLQVLLELQRRNPNADANALISVLQEVTARYRTNAPSYIRTRGSRDEILAAYLGALRQVSARTNLVPANFSLLNTLITRAQPPTLEPQADMIHSGSQSLLGSEGELVQRQALLDVCVARAWGNSRFRAAMDAVLMPETLASLDNTPAEIIANTNSPLHDNPTMTNLLVLTLASGNGSLSVSSNQLMNLFSDETQTFWDTINTNLAVQSEINRSQPDLLAYLTNQPAIDATAQRLTEVKQGQARRIASATAAILVQSKLMKAKEPLIKLPGQMQGIMEGLHRFTEGLAAVSDTDVSKLAKIAASGNVLAGGLELLNLFTGGESAEDEIAREIGNIKTLLGDLSTNINYRFDRVDQSLTTIFNTLNDRFDQVEITLDSQGRQIAHLNGDVDQIRLSLIDVQTDLFRIERNLATFHALDWRIELVEAINYVRGFEARVGAPMEYRDNAPYDFISFENTFYTHAFNRAAWEPLSLSGTLPFGDQYFYSQLSPGGATNVYAEILNYIKKCLRQRLGLPGFEEQPILVNPQDWAAGAVAWLQLALENPGHFRRYERDVGFPRRLDGIISKARELTNFIGSLTFLSGTNINWPLYAAVQNFYVSKLSNFSAQVRSTEQSASGSAFALDTWRQWSANAPRLNAIATEVLVTHPLTLPPIPRDATDIAAGGYHSLALKRDGTVVAWGRNDERQSTIPPGATNVAAIAAGGDHSLAVRSNGLVVAWGSNAYGQTNTSTSATNVIAVSAGHHHSLALRADGSVVGWGAGRAGTSEFPHFGQATIPGDATNIIAIAAGGYHSLALKSDHTVLGWGLNNEGQLNAPEGATNVIAIAAGHGHNLALKGDGTLVAWGNNVYGSINVPAAATNIVAIAAAGWHCLAKRSDGKVFSWGRSDTGQTAVPFSLGGVQKLAAGLLHSLALKEDGTVVSWGWNNQRQSIVPPALSWANALSANWTHFLALKPDGTVAEYATEPDYGTGLKPTPANATNGVAMAAGGSHNLLLQANGKVVAWGDNFFGQTNTPGSATNVAAVAAGDSYNLALKGDGTVVGWGNNQYGQATGVPNTNYPFASTGVVAVAGQTLSNVVALAASGHSLALRADGLVVGWGWNAEGQATGVPNTNYPYFSAAVVTLGGQPLSNVMMVAGGGNHSLALRTDGTVIAWGNNQSGQTNVPASVTNVVAIAAAAYHNLALRADGTVVAWGGGENYGETNPPSTATNVVAIAASGQFSVALRADGTIIAWGEYFQGHMPIPTRETNVISVAAGRRHSIALRSDGTVVGWSDNSDGRAIPPASATNVVAVAAGAAHSLALKADRTVIAWGDNYYGQRNPPASAHGAVAISAGHIHNLALKPDGTIVGWGYNLGGAATGVRGGGPGFVIFEGRILTNVVAIAAGSGHSLALRADGTVVGWGWNRSGEATGVPTSSSPYFGAGVVTRAGNNVVAIAAGYSHSLALRADGTVVAWGDNFFGQTNRPPEAINVVAIAAGYNHNLALRADGTVVGWGRGSQGQTTIPAEATNVVAIAGGDSHSLFLKVTETGPVGIADPFVVRGQIPERVGELLYGVNGVVLTNLNLGLHSAGIELSGSKGLLQAVLELAMPYTLERDDVLHGFLYGSESLVDLDASRSFLEAENAKLNARPDSRPQTLGEIAALRFQRFNERLNARLNDLAAAGEPELPRMVGQTLRQLHLLRDAWASVPPPTLELDRATNNVQLLLYGEPYAHYTLQYRSSLSVPNWTTTVTNLHDEQFITLPPSEPQRFYRAMLPLP
jgi:alpha-tubulin suppressor-like RCC1 family protein